MSVHTSERMEEKVGERGEDVFLKILPICIVLAGFPGNDWEHSSSVAGRCRDLGAWVGGGLPAPAWPLCAGDVALGWGLGVLHSSQLTFQEAWVAGSSQPSLSTSQFQASPRWGPPCDHKAADL